MNNSFETNFIPQTVEKKPFADIPAQNFFGEWCRINDSIIPQFISREDWEKRGVQGILEKNNQGKRKLFLPEDLHLWQMMDVIKTIDHDTLVRNPEKREEKADKIKELGEIFEKAGIYLSQYLPTLKDNQEKTIAEDIAREFYQYGLLLQHKERRVDQISDATVLSLEDKTKLDEWFLGGDAYQKRLARLGDNPTEEQMEEIRKKLFAIYFKALGREGYKADGEKPWETKVGPAQHLQDITRRQIIKALEAPEREMKSAIFRRGVEKLVTEMRETIDMYDKRTGIITPDLKGVINNFLKKVGFDPFLEQRRLHDTLHIDTLKKELEEARQTGDIAKVSAKELEIAKKIERTVSSFPYKKGANNPSEMVETQFINCVGASILGGGLLDEIGIKYLHVDLPEHSATVLITSDGKVYWQDFTPPNGGNVNYIEIRSDMLEGDIDLSKLTSIPDSGLTIEFKNWEINNNKLRVNLFRPEVGLQIHILTNTGSVLSDLGRKEEAIAAYQQAISVDPKSADPYNGLGNVLSDLGRKEEAIAAYQQAISVDPKSADPYNGLGNVLRGLGRKEEAIAAYQQFIKLWKGDEYWINRAKRIIEKLQK